MAGMRDPAALVETWPKLWKVMAQIKAVLLQAWEDMEDLRNLTGACGADPARNPPEAATLVELRRRLATALGVEPKDFEDHHPASPWRYALVRALQVATDDPDEALHTWLRDGAPMGVTKVIEPGGLFPTWSPWRR